MRKEGGGAEIKTILKVLFIICICACARKEEGEQGERGFGKRLF